MAGSAWILVHARGVVLRKDDASGVMRALTEGEARLVAGDVAGYDAGTLGEEVVLAAPFDGTVAAPYEIVGARALAALGGGHLVSSVLRAMHVVDWATTSRFCGRCGARTERVASERCMRCPACGLSQYPRIAPAIIVLVRKGELALLASNAKFPGVFYSTLAGFSDIGESLEETLVREVREESGVEVKDVRYFGSQPWPFPHSLMIGFTAEWAGGEIVVDTNELADARWFAIDELPTIPPPFSIARKLIDDWIADVKRSRG